MSLSFNLTGSPTRSRLSCSSLIPHSSTGYRRGRARSLVRQLPRMGSGKIAIVADDAQDEQPVTNRRVNGFTVCTGYSPVHQPMNSSKLILLSPSLSVISNASRHSSSDRSWSSLFSSDANSPTMIQPSPLLSQVSKLSRSSASSAVLRSFIVVSLVRPQRWLKARSCPRTRAILPGAAELLRKEIASVPARRAGAVGGVQQDSQVDAREVG